MGRARRFRNFRNEILRNSPRTKGEKKLNSSLKIEGHLQYLWQVSRVSVAERESRIYTNLLQQYTDQSNDANV